MPKHTPKPKQAPKPKKPAQPRAPRKEPPLGQVETLFCHLVMKGDGTTNTNQTKRIVEAGKKCGYTAEESNRVYHRKPVQKYIETYRDRLMIEMVKSEVRLMHKQGYTKDYVLSRLDDLSLIPVEKTRGSIAGQVAALAEMGKIMGLVSAPKNPDEFFKGRSIEEMAYYAEHGTFAPPRVN